MTEEDAKTKWCPLASVGVGIVDSGFKPGHVGNRLAFAPSKVMEQTKYIGSACMAWREQRTPVVADPPRGFCGAFGAAWLPR